MIMITFIHYVITKTSKQHRRNKLVSIMALQELLIIATILTITNSLTDADKRAQASAVIDKQFHSVPTTRRFWRQDNSAQGDYRRYLCRQIYCSGTSSDPSELCWHISLHIHHETQKQFDRIYLYEYNSISNVDHNTVNTEQAFMGSVQKINSAEFNQHGIYDIVAGELARFTNANLKTTNGRPTDCISFCYIYHIPPIEVTKTLRIESLANKLSVRANPDNEQELEPEGSLGELAKWEINIYNVDANTGAKVEGGMTMGGTYYKECRIKNIKTGKWARFQNGGDVLEITGGDGMSSVAKFKIVTVNDADGTSIKFESKQWPGIEFIHFVYSLLLLIV